MHHFWDLAPDVSAAESSVVSDTESACVEDPAHVHQLWDSPQQSKGPGPRDLESIGALGQSLYMALIHRTRPAMITMQLPTAGCIVSSVGAWPRSGDRRETAF